MQMAMTVQTMCAEFSLLVNGLRKLKHETKGQKREALPKAVQELLNAHQADLQTLETTALELWVELGSQLVPATMPEVPEPPAADLVRVVPAFPEHVTEPPPRDYQEKIPD